MNAYEVFALGTGLAYENFIWLVLLILDDWGLEGFQGRQITDLLDVIEDRYERKSTIIISQLPVSQWYDLMDNPTVADALLDRLIHNAHRLELQGESQRKKSLDKEK